MKGFFKVSNAVVGIGLTAPEMHVYVSLASWGNNGKVVHKSYNQIASQCGLAKQTVFDAIEILFAGGLINKTVRRAGRKSNYVNEYVVFDSFNQDVAISNIEKERSRRKEEKRRLDRLEKMGRSMETSVQAQTGTTVKKITKMEAISIGQEIEAERQKAKNAVKWIPAGGVASGV